MGPNALQERLQDIPDRVKYGLALVAATFAVGSALEQSQADAAPTNEGIAGMALAAQPRALTLTPDQAAAPASPIEVANCDTQEVGLVKIGSTYKKGSSKVQASVTFREMPDCVGIADPVSVKFTPLERTQTRKNHKLHYNKLKSAGQSKIITSPQVVKSANNPSNVPIANDAKAELKHRHILSTSIITHKLWALEADVTSGTAKSKKVIYITPSQVPNYKPAPKPTKPNTNPGTGGSGGSNGGHVNTDPHFKTGPPQSFDTSTSKGEAAYEKKAKAQMVKCPNNNEAGLVLGGNLLPNTTQKTTSNRWATITETYATKADGPHPHFKVTLKTVGGKKASLCDDYFVAKSSTGKQKVTIDALVGGEATSPYAIDKDGNGSAQLNVDLTTP